MHTIIKTFTFKHSSTEFNALMYVVHKTYIYYMKVDEFLT